jgi:hypothetical protein
MELLVYYDKKTMKHASADVGLIFSAYNLRQIFYLVDQNPLKIGSVFSCYER